MSAVAPQAVLRPSLPGPPDCATRMRVIRAVAIATAENFQGRGAVVDVYLGGTWPGREWDGWTIEEASLAAAETWRTEGEA
jgi:hypothetical protein